MKYQLANSTSKNTSVIGALRRFWPLLRADALALYGALFAILVSSLANLVAPLIIGFAVDNYIQTKQYPGVLQTAAVLLVIYVLAAAATYIQTKLMGTVGQKLLFTLRSEIFTKLQSLPLAFFNQNKAGDLISRINNDTDKLNQFFSQALMQFINNAFLMIGAGIFLVVLNFELGTVTLLPAVGLFVCMQFLSVWIKKQNAISLHAVGDLSAEISESLNNFKLIAVFNRRDYFRTKFETVNAVSYQSAIKAGLANNSLNPVFGLASNVAQLIVLFYGCLLITRGQLSLGLLVSYLSYVSKFYDPVRQIASIWSTFQVALAGWDRIAEILHFKSDLEIVPKNTQKKTTTELLTFDNVSFSYDDGKEVLHAVSFTLQPGKTYAFVGPTGGGKTTTASLMSRLFDPTIGKVLFQGQDLRSLTEVERTQKIGFILQEPFLFSGTVHDSILYGNAELQHLTVAALNQLLQDFGLAELLQRFPQGLATEISSKGETISLGQQQLIAFMRAVLRKPELLILDEATANVDTVTEKLLDEILTKLSKQTTKVIIAHRFNTIENADEIFFVNDGEVQKAGTLEHAMQLLLDQKSAS